MTKPAILALADGSIFRGEAIGADGQTVGEVVFNTAMTGYQEILTDPSYAQQIVTLTYPHIGNTGTTPEDAESDRVWSAGLVIRDLPLVASNWRNKMSLGDYLKASNVVAIAGIDTRRLTRILREKGAPIVIKADGLAAGKGVIVAMTLTEAEDAVRDMLAGNAFGEAGSRVVIEEFLDGEEASFIVMVDGKNVLPMATSQDHKRVGDGDSGPNTGGMGAYSPAPVVTAEVHQRVMDLVIWPTVRGMADEGNVYTGFLYAGLMIDKAGNPKVIEFNCRFGDPETQPVMLRLQSSLVLLIEAALAQALDKVEAQWDPRPSLGIVLAAGGYPGDYAKGAVIEGLDAAAQLEGKVFHAGTTLQDDRVVTSGGRVLCATALGDSVGSAQKNAYALAAKVDWQGCFYRTDIGYRAIARERGEDQE
ncbi:phosphoribosylamine--glycine ligase [Pseudomonas syringae pv. actinidiae]|nr:phosphoribosylamine--glycine ligase [Pseudomonas syringae pv. actinidiae]